MRPMIKLALFAASLGLMANHANANDLMGYSLASHSTISNSYSVAMPSSYNVELNNTQVIYLPQSASAVIVGNPNIADISIHSNDTIFVMGRGYGNTNLIVLNGQNQTIMDADINVTAPASRNNVRVYDGSMRKTYNCSPYCQPAPILGDDAEHMSAFSPESVDINNTVATGASSIRTN